MCPVMVRWLGILVGTLRSIIRTRRELALENLALRQQLAVWKARQPRPRPTAMDRLFWLLLSRLWKSERHLMGILAEYVDYYNRTRTHLSLTKDAPEPRSVQPPSQGRVVEVPRTPPVSRVHGTDGATRAGSARARRACESTPAARGRTRSPGAR